LLASCSPTRDAAAPRDATTPEETTAATVDGLKVETLVSGLDTPWEVAFAPDGRIFVTERPGTIRVIEDGGLREEPYATLPVDEMGEGGQLGLALDPNFEQNGYLYAYYSTQEGGEATNRLVRLVEEDGTAREDEVLLEGPAASIHNGGRVAIGPDGRLYATLGDVSDSGLAQDREALAGKIVRLNLDGSIPDDNPFSGSPVYSYGHRNPQGLAWDEDGNLYAPEHGQSAHDELNLVEPGGNYGWPEIEGDEEAPGLETPILHSGEETWAPSGAAYADEGPWEGSVLFTGLRGESLHRVTFAEDPGEVQSHEEYLEGEFGRLRTVAQGPDGAFYVLTSNQDGRGSPEPEDDRLLRVTVPER
jgi:glucose/arabinose dehydrogenase